MKINMNNSQPKEARIYDMQVGEVAAFKPHRPEANRQTIIIKISENRFLKLDGEGVTPPYEIMLGGLERDGWVKVNITDIALEYQ